MGKKLRLDLEDLKVESFATTPSLEGGRGTVYAQDTFDYACTNIPGCGVGSMGYPQCGPTDTCDNTCHTNNTCCYLTDGCATGDPTACTGDTYDPNCQATVNVTCGNSCTDNGCTACGSAC